MSDDDIVKSRVNGKSVRAIARSQRVSADRVHSVLDRWADQALHPQLRKVALATELEKLDQLTQVFHEKALAGDVDSARLELKIIERKGTLLGLHTPQRATLEIIDARIQRPTSSERLEQALENLLEDKRRQQEAEPALIVDGKAETQH